MPRYAELHCHSNFSFLDGASHPHDLVRRAVELGYEALAITDHNGFYGAPRFRIVAAEAGLPTVYGVEIGLPRASGTEKPVTSHQSPARTRRTGDWRLETGDSRPQRGRTDHLVLLA